MVSIFFISYLLIGIIAGTLSGMLGIGGGVIVIPLLVVIYKLQNFAPNAIMHLAAGTSLAVMILNASSSIYAHTRHKIEIWPTYKKLALGIIIGTIIGALLSHNLSSTVLEIIFGIFMLLVSIQMLFGKKPKASRKLPGPLLTNSIAFAIGGKSGLLGIGGGAITIPFLHYCNVPIRNIVGISAACSLTIAIIGSISFALTGMHTPNLPPWSIGYIYLPAVLGIALTGPLFARFGAKISHKLPKETLKKILAIVLLLMAIKMLT